MNELIPDTASLPDAEPVVETVTPTPTSEDVVKEAVAATSRHLSTMDVPTDRIYSIALTDKEYHDGIPPYRQEGSRSRHKPTEVMPSYNRWLVDTDDPRLSENRRSYHPEEHEADLGMFHPSRKNRS
jgi:hypothetical protein